jgi:hypothetical protein
MIRYLVRYKRSIATSLVFLITIQSFYTPAFALTSGPSQPEVQGFQPAGTSDMVDLFTGDFSYNIPLFELPGPNGGYPFNLSYQAGIGMDAEASWVGLGFSLNPGAINRQMRGLPDEFKGDPIFTKMSIDPSVTVGLGAGVNLELFGASGEIGTVGLGVTYNNFKGFGYSIDGSVGFKTSASSGMTAGIGLNFSLDSKEGVSATPSLSLGGKMGSLGLSTGYNSKSGLSSVSGTVESNTGFTTQGSLTLANPGYTPQVSMPMRNLNIAARFSPGGSWWGIFAKGYIRGFYGEQWLHNNKKRVRSDGYGYLNYQDGIGNAEAVLDFNREKDGMVSKESPNLPIPSLTYDIYSVSGQGISAMYRPIRNDVGIIHDPESISKSVGGSVGVDVGPAASHVGVNLNVNHSKSVSGAWVDRNAMTSVVSFQTKKIDKLFEPAYFKVHGESTGENSKFLTSIGGTKPVRVKLSGPNVSASASSTLEGKNTNHSIDLTANNERKKRSQVIETITNEELISNGKELVSHFKIKYLDHSGAEDTFNRSGLPGHHVAAFSALTPEGLRYNYGIPVYNLKQEEVTFSANKQTGQTSKVNVCGGEECDPNSEDPKYDYYGTEKYLKRVELPPFAHSYLLTSIIGPDYVDVTNDGVTEDDLGYWVKFTYQKTTSSEDPYKWRDPYSKAHYQEGWKTDPRDDKGSFVYGEKELWYLTKAETKSHITTFTLEDRHDGKGVNAKIQNKDQKGKSVKALKEIKLFTRSAGIGHPIKVIKFEYDYSLCPGVYNSDSLGKLTLKKLWFEYGNSQRGRLNPYLFTYHQNNPSYDQHAYDRWGNYKPYPSGDYLHNIDFPYSEQDPLKKESIDNNAASWSLSEIQLPSGGKIMVDYESDDYGYVQHLPAMQMVEIVNPDGVTASDGSFDLNNNAQVKFKLEKPIEGTLTAEQRKAEVLKYLDQRRKQLFFKVKINLRSSGENFYEYISGYADINFAPEATMDLHKDGSGKYVYGSFYLLKEKDVHPFALRAWQHIRTNQPELANTGKKFEATEDNGERVAQIKSMGSVFTQIRQMFEGFYDYCKGKGWGKQVIAGKSWVRLNSPDKIKYGGGLRVRQITMKDNWADDEEGIYGQVYEYTTEENGQIISSGVAAYEPLIGGEENSLRYAKKYVQSVPLRSDNNMFFEFPVNESYYPGPQVGYGKVTVSSLAAAALAGKELKNITLTDGKRLLPKTGPGVSYGTSGVTVHEFYTAKEYPVIAEETDKDNKPYNLSVPIPFLGNVSVSNLTSSQGYSIVTNDMHGKQKKVSSYRQDRQGKVEPQPISWVKYNYFDEARVYQEQKVYGLTAQFKENGDGSLSPLSKEEIANPAISKFVIGQENEFFLDMREHEDNTWEGGVNVNIDIVYILWLTIPLPTVWPSVGKSSQKLRTAVANKVMFQSGILKSVEAYDGGSKVITENLKWDKLTGGVLLTRVNNNFDAPIYSYNIPAYSKYQGMGAAYQNLGLRFTISNIERAESGSPLYIFKSNVQELFPGDEILLYDANSDFKNAIAKVIYTGEEEGDNLLHSEMTLSASSYKAMIVRSGYRNQLSVSAGSITALEDPTKQGTGKNYSKVLTLPNE